jgi:RimJ/RimL family protein N-acetyltransferase
MPLSAGFDDTVLTSPRLSMRAFVREDVAEISAPIAPSIYRFINWDGWPTATGLPGIWQDWLDMLARGTGLVLVLRRRDRRDLIGMSGLHFVEQGEPTAGLWIRDSVQGQGFGSEAMESLTSWAFNERAARGVLFPVFDSHEPSRRIAERLGGSPAEADPRVRAPIYRGKMVLYRIPRPHVQPSQQRAASRRTTT